MPTAAEKRFTAFCIVMLLLVHCALLIMQWGNIQAARPDFAALYASGKLALNSHVDVVTVGHTAIPADTLHPPIELLILAPLAHLAYTHAFLLWYVFNLAMVISVPFLLREYIGNVRHWFAYIVIFAGTFFPVLVAVIQGQDSILLLFLLTLSYRFMKAKRPFVAGLLLAAGMFKFTLVIPITIAFVVIKEWRFLSGLATGLLALLAGTALAFGNSSVLRYASFLAQEASLGAAQKGIETSSQEAIMPNLRGFLHALTNDTIGGSRVNILVIVLSILVLSVVAKNWKRVTDYDATFDLLFSIQVIAAVLVSYHLFVHDACILLLPILLVTNLFASDRRKLLPIEIATAIMYFCPFVASLRISMPIFSCSCIGLLCGLYLAGKNMPVVCDAIKTVPEIEALGARSVH